MNNKIKNFLILIILLLFIANMAYGDIHIGPSFNPFPAFFSFGERDKSAEKGEKVLYTKQFQVGISCWVLLVHGLSLKIWPKKGFGLALHYYPASSSYNDDAFFKMSHNAAALSSILFRVKEGEDYRFSLNAGAVLSNPMLGTYGILFEKFYDMYYYEVYIGNYSIIIGAGLNLN